MQDNGHLNMRTQTYSTNTPITQIMLNREKITSPGPGSYEITQPIFESQDQLPETEKNRKLSPNKTSGAIINPITVVKSISPGRAAAVVSNPSLQKMSVPSIPSRYLTPIIDQSTNEAVDEGICKMNRLINDPTRVGPGTYELIED